MVPQLYQQIGRLQVELEWLKKNTNRSVAERRAMIEVRHAPLSVAKQCELLGCRGRVSTIGGRPPRRSASRSCTPSIASTPSILSTACAACSRRCGTKATRSTINGCIGSCSGWGCRRSIRDRVGRPGDASHRVYPYLLRDRVIDRPDQVWASGHPLPAATGWIRLSGGDHGLGSVATCSPGASPTP